MLPNNPGMFPAQYFITDQPSFVNGLFPIILMVRTPLEHMKAPYLVLWLKATDINPSKGFKRGILNTAHLFLQL